MVASISKIGVSSGYGSVLVCNTVSMLCGDAEQRTEMYNILQMRKSRGDVKYLRLLICYTVTVAKWFLKFKEFYFLQLQGLALHVFKKVSFRKQRNKTSYNFKKALFTAVYNIYKIQYNVR
jgi:hypothetical protein